MDSVINEICRTPRGGSIREDVLRRWQRHLRLVVQPQLDELAQLKATVSIDDAPAAAAAPATSRRRPA